MTTSTHEKQRFGATTKQVFGCVTHSSFNGVHTMSTVMTVADLLRACSFDLIPPHLKSLYKEIQRVASPSRRQGFEDYCFKHLTSSTDISGVIPPVLIGCMSDVEVELSEDPRMNDALVMHPDRNFVVDGVNRLSTIATVLGGYDQSLLKKVKESDSRLKRRVELSRLMHDLSVQVLFIFRMDRALSETDFAQIFADVNGQAAPMSTNKLMKLARTDDVVTLAREIGTLPIVESHGGMSMDSNTVTAKSEFILTLNTVTRFILGALGGERMQSRVRGVREMGDGAILSKKHLEPIRSDLVLFFETWIDCQGDAYSQDRTGFQLVATLIQGLGLVFNNLWVTYQSIAPVERTNHIYQAAKKLGGLDYSRAAKHWADCNCVTLSESGMYVVNTGGSTSRKGFAQHLSSRIGVQYRSR
ncbi:DNA sulfur modification protein DndB [Vibrio campbellii]|uniref:DNA sulfur modification protein DndB n=1 Tax=Vibrio campbellii TaxID=680 RepID=UPI0005F09BD5|nr:DNA sulfur modification protein DndB [Vibrio campbellii]